MITEFQLSVASEKLDVSVALTGNLSNHEPEDQETLRRALKDILRICLRDRMERLVEPQLKALLENG
jgi:hypothetical protein